MIRATSKETSMGPSCDNNGISQKQILAVSRGLLHQLFIELDKMYGKQLETAMEQEVQVIDVDAAPSINFHDVTVTPKVLSLQRAVDEALTAPIARPALTSASPTPT